MAIRSRFSVRAAGSAELGGSSDRERGVAIQGPSSALYRVVRGLRRWTADIPSHQKRRKGGRVGEPMNRSVELGQARQIPIPEVSSVPDNEAEERPIEPFAASGAEVFPSSSAPRNGGPVEAPPKAKPSRIVEMDYRIGPGESLFERSTIVTVHDPTWLGDQGADLIPPDVTVGTDPSGLPIVQIEMDQG